MGAFLPFPLDYFPWVCQSKASSNHPAPDHTHAVSAKLTTAPHTAAGHGTLQVMLTPFTEDGSAVDYDALRALSTWYLESGAVGLFPVAQSSEMYLLSAEEVWPQTG